MTHLLPPFPASRPVRAAVVQPPILLPDEFIDYPPLMPYATAATAAALRAAGCEVAAFDAGCLPGAEFARVAGGWRWGVAPDEFRQALTGHRFDLIVLAQSVFQRSPANVAVLADLLADFGALSPRPLIVLADQAPGGMHTNDTDAAARLAALPGADLLAAYESDAAMSALLAGWRAGALPPGPAGGPAVLPGWAEQLDDLPDPAWDLLDVNAYQRALDSALAARSWSFSAPGSTLPMLASRGCPYRCRFCFPEKAHDAGVKTGAFRRCSAPRARAQLAALAARGVRHVVFLDGTLNGHPAWFGELLAALADLGLTADVPNGLRADQLDDRDVPRLVGRLPALWVSAESGDQQTVDRLDKRLALDDVRRVAAACRRAGLPLGVHFMIGLPGETRAALNRTLLFAWELFEEHGARPSIQFATPFPGTPLYREAVALGFLPADAPAPERLPELTTVRPVMAPPRPVAGGPWPVAGGRPEPDTEHRTPDTEHRRGAPPPDRALLERLRARFVRRLELAAQQKLIVNLTYRCNSQCTFCATSDRVRKDGSFETQLATLRAARARGVRLLDIDGGEPTLAPHLGRFIRAARALGFERVTVTTNGRLLSYPENARRLLKAGVTGVLVSMHGPDAAVHEAITQTPGSFPETLAGLRRVLAVLPSRLLRGVNTTVTTENLAHLDAMGALMAREGVPQWNLQVVTPFGRARTGRLVPDLAATGRALDAVLRRFHDRLLLRIINMPFCFLPGWEHLLVEDVGKVARTMSFIDTDAEVLFYYLGSRRRWLDACPDCEWRIMCGGVQQFEGSPARGSGGNGESDTGTERNPTLTPHASGLTPRTVAPAGQPALP